MKITKEMLREELVLSRKKDKMTNQFAQYADEIAKWYLDHRAQKQAEEAYIDIVSNFHLKLLKDDKWKEINPDGNISSYLLGAIKYRILEYHRAFQRSRDREWRYAVANNPLSEEEMLEVREEGYEEYNNSGA